LSCYTAKKAACFVVENELLMSYIQAMQNFIITGYVEKKLCYMKV